MLIVLYDLGNYPSTFPFRTGTFHVPAQVHLRSNRMVPSKEIPLLKVFFRRRPQRLIAIIRRQRRSNHQKHLAINYIASVLL